MLRELAGGSRLALRRWPSVIALAGMIALACLVLVVVLGDVLSEAAVLRGGTELRHRRAVTFTPYYGSGDVTRVDDATVSSLVHQIGGAAAYTAIMGNVEVDHPGFADGIPTIVLFGDVLPSLYPDLHLCSPAPCAMRGTHLAGRQINPIDFAGDHLDPDGVLPSSATYFDVNAAGLSLDDRIVLHLPADRLLRVDPDEREEALWRAVLLAPAPRDVDAYTSACARQGLSLVPHDIAVDQPRRFRDLLIRSAMYLVGLAGFLGLVLSAFSSAAAAAMRREAAALAIRRMYGATPVLVTARVGAYLAVTVLALPVPLLLLLRLLGDPIAAGASWVLVMVICIFGGLWALTTSRVLVRDPVRRESS